MKLENFIIKETKADLLIKLTDEEIHNKYINAIKKLKEIKIKKEQFMLLKKSWRDSIKELQEEVNQLNTIIENGMEKKLVKCDIVYDINKKIKYISYKGDKYNEEIIDDKELASLRNGTIEDFIK